MVADPAPAADATEAFTTLVQIRVHITRNGGR